MKLELAGEPKQDKLLYENYDPFLYMGIIYLLK